MLMRHTRISSAAFAGVAWSAVLALAACMPAAEVADPSAERPTTLVPTSADSVPAPTTAPTSLSSSLTPMTSATRVATSTPTPTSIPTPTSTLDPSATSAASAGSVAGADAGLSVDVASASSSPADDVRILADIRRAIAATPLLTPDAKRVSIKVKDGTVSLHGTVHNEEARASFEAIARHTRGTKRVESDLHAMNRSPIDVDPGPTGY